MWITHTTEFFSVDIFIVKETSSSLWLKVVAPSSVMQILLIWCHFSNPEHFCYLVKDTS